MTTKHYYKEAFERAPIDRQEKIIECGIEEFSTQGYENANINVIAKKSEISIGLMYKYFSSKEDLFITCLQRGIEVLDEAIFVIMESGEKLLNKAQMLIRTIVKYSSEYSKYAKMYNEIASQRDLGIVNLMISEIEKKRSKMYISAITQAKENGDVRKDLDPKAFAFFLDNLIISLLFSYTCEYYKERFKIYYGVDIDESDEDMIVNQLLKFVESAFTFEK